ncbi:GreA/GreB family elongation factor [bacterium]|nr:GreA/GreB family elongation factor [bacterium]
MPGTMITELDYKRLMGMMHNSIQSHPAEQFHFLDLYHGILGAEVVKSEEIPNDIVTMRSVVSLANPETGQTRRVELAYPNEADPTANKISILSPLGTAIIGNHVGIVVEYNDCDGRSQFRIDSLEYQPEAAGRYDL